jgi:hypothetical protein
MSLTKVTFSMIDKISINVRDYGATGDGTTDDAPAIQNAIDAAGAAGGGVVYFPPGTYRVATVYSQHGGTVTGVPNDDRQFLVIGYDNIRLVGDGATIFCNNVTAGFRLNMIMVYDCSNVIIENLIFDNNGLDISQSRTQAIVTQSATEIIIDKCKLQNSTFGIFIYKLSENVRISNCWFDGGWGVATGGDDLGNDPGVISDVIIENNAFLSVAGESVDINQDTRNFIIRNNFCYNSNTDVDGLTPTDAENIDIGGDDALQYGLIEGNTIIDLRQYIHGIQVKQDSVNIKIVNNRIINTANNPTDTWGIRIAPANQTMIHGNHINGYTYSINSSASASDNREIYIANNICENFYVGAIAIASNNCKIEGNLIKLVSRAGVSLGIYVAGNPENVNINGNNINVDPTLDNAIWVNGASEVNIANNNIQGSVIGIQISSVSNASCVGNTVKGCGEESLLIENSTNITANGNNFSNGNETGGTWSVTFNNVNNGIFNGNVLCDTRNSGQTMFGTVNADASCDYIIFTSNSVFNCTAANIGINGAVTNKVAANNLT